jgi:hypothetical protein
MSKSNVDGSMSIYCSLVVACVEKEALPMSARATDIESAEAAISALGQQWETNFMNRDAAGLAALYTDDCVRMPNGG